MTADTLTADSAELRFADSGVPVWGTSLAPLLPRWYRQAFASVEAPEEIAAITGFATLAHTTAGWSQTGETADESTLGALAAAVEGFPPPPGTVVAPTGAALAALAVRARTRRAFDAVAARAGGVTVADLLSLRGFGTFALLDVMCAIEAGQHADRAGKSDLDSARRAAAEAARAVEELLASADAVDLCVARGRLGVSTAMTLTEAGRQAGCSRETVRRRENRIRAAAAERATPAAAEAAAWVKDRLGLAASRSDLDQAVKECMAAVGDGTAAGMVEHLLRSAAGYQSAPAAGYVVSPEGADAVSQILSTADALADEVGLAEESDLIAALADRVWVGELNDLVAASGMVTQDGIVDVASRGSNAQVKAALIRCGTPATAQRLADMTGIGVRRVSTVLSALPSVVRTDKQRWGLRRWRCGEYLGIAGEMKARIEAAGGATDLPQLAQTLSRLYGVRRGSIYTMARTPEFSVDGATIRVAEEPQVVYPPLAEVADGEHGGDPCWTFEVGPQHLRGCSIATVPPAVAVALGCDLGSRILVPVREPAGSPDVSVIWRTTCISGPEIGRSSKALAGIGVQSGDSVRVVVHPDASVSFVAETDSP